LKPASATSETRVSEAGHFIRPRRRSPLLRIFFLFILGLLTFSVWLIALHVPVHVGAPLVLIYDLMLFSILLIKPQPIFGLRKE
jgi:hypothetical protein